MGLESMNVKIGADLTGLYKGAADATKIITDVGNSAAQIAAPLSRSAAAADALQASLTKMAEQGNARLQAMADKALGISPLITNLSRNVAAFGGGVAANTVPEYFKKVGEEAAKSETVVKKAHEGITAGSQNAKYAVLDLGHVFRDLPFALNNPALLTGPFDRAAQAVATLKQTTAETGQSMGSLVKGALLGPIGVLAAIELIGAGLSIFGPKLSAYFHGGADAADELKNKIKLLTDVQQEANKQAGQQIVDARVLYDTAINVNAAMADRLDAVKTLKKEFPDFFSQIKNEAILNGNAKSSYDELTKSILENARGLAARNKLSEIESQRLDIDFQKQKIINATNQELNAAKGTSFTDESGRQIVDFTKRDAQKVIEIRRDAALKDQDDKDKALARQADFLIKFAGGEGKISAAITDDTHFGKDPKAKAHIKDLDDVLKQLNSELVLNQKLADIGFISSGEQDVAKIQKVKSAIEEILKLKKGPGVNSSIVSNLILSIQPEEARVQLSERLKEVVKTIRPNEFSKELLEVKIPTELRPSLSIKNNLLHPEIEAWAQGVKDLIKQSLTSGFTGLGEAVGDAIAGKGGLGDVFGSVFKTIGGFIKQLGVNMIEASTLIITLKNALASFFPQGSLIAGIGLVALGQLMQTAIPKFAGGVTGFGGGAALVGELGPEIVQLPQGSNVIPNHRLSGITGGVQVFIPTITFRGADMLVQFNRANQQSSRNG